MATRKTTMQKVEEVEEVTEEQSEKKPRVKKGSLEYYIKQVDSTDKKIEKKEKSAEAIREKIREQEKKLAPIEKELADLRLERSEAWNNALVQYMMTHHNQDGQSYFDSFSATIEHQQATGKPAENVFDADGVPQGRLNRTAAKARAKTVAAKKEATEE